VVGRLRIDQAPNSFDTGDAGGDEDRRDHEQAGPPFGTRGPQQERNPKRYRGGRVAEVVDQVGKQRNAAGEDEHQGLSKCGGAKHGERDADSPQAFLRVLDAVVDEPVGVPMATIVVRLNMVLVWMGVRPRVRVCVDPEAMAM
jgi:hypothetical protein